MFVNCFIGGDGEGQQVGMHLYFISLINVNVNYDVFGIS